MDLVLSCIASSNLRKFHFFFFYWVRRLKFYAPVLFFNSWFLWREYGNDGIVLSIFTVFSSGIVCQWWLLLYLCWGWVNVFIHSFSAIKHFCYSQHFVYPTNQENRDRRKGDRNKKKIWVIPCNFFLRFDFWPSGEMSSGWYKFTIFLIVFKTKSRMLQKIKYLTERSWWNKFTIFYCFRS